MVKTKGKHTKKVTEGNKFNQYYNRKKRSHSKKSDNSAKGTEIKETQKIICNLDFIQNEFESNKVLKKRKYT